MVNMEILAKCSETDGNLGLGGTTMHICRVLLMSDTLSLVWVIQCTLQNFQFHDFLKLDSSPNFHPTSTKVYCKYVDHEGI